MSAIASPEFVSLCQSQLRLLTQRLSECATALYIADISELGDEPSNFVPVASYPEPVDSWVANFERAAPWSSPSAGGPLALPGAAKEATKAAAKDLRSANYPTTGFTAEPAG